METLEPHEVDIDGSRSTTVDPETGKAGDDRVFRHGIREG